MDKRVKNMESIAINSEKDMPIKFKNWLKKAFKDNLDQIDAVSEWDRSLTISENIGIFKDKFSSMFDSEYVEEIRLSDMKDKEKTNKEFEMNEARKEEKELIENWKKSDYEEISIKSFDVPQHLIRMVCRKNANGCVLTGFGGSGKTFCAINTIKAEKIEFEYQNSYATPLELFKWLYLNKDKICVLDDCEGIFNNPKSLAILKAVLWDTDGRRIVTMLTTDRYLEGTPKTFEFKGGVVILSNKIKENEHISALLSRTMYYELNFTYKEKLKVMQEISKKAYKNTTQKDRDLALTMLINATDVTTDELNFRSLIKTYELIQYNPKKAESILKSTIKANEPMKLVMELLKNNKSEQERIYEFFEKTGLHRSTYFGLKRQLKELMK